MTDDCHYLCHLLTSRGVVVNDSNYMSLVDRSDSDDMFQRNGDSHVDREIVIVDTLLLG